MTIQEMIDLLQKEEDKSLPLMIKWYDDSYDDPWGSITEFSDIETTQVFGKEKGWHRELDKTTIWPPNNQKRIAYITF